MGYPASEGFRDPGKGMQPPGADNIAQWEWLLLWGFLLCSGRNVPGDGRVGSRAVGKGWHPA